MKDEAFVRDIELNYALYWGTKSYQASSGKSSEYKNEFKHYFITKDSSEAERRNQPYVLGNSHSSRALKALNDASKANNQAIRDNQGSNIIPLLRARLSETFGSFSASLYVVKNEQKENIEAFKSEIRDVPNAKILYFGDLSLLFLYRPDLIGDYLAAIPEHIQAINLYKCFPATIRPKEIIAVLSRIPYHVRSISLRGIWKKNDLTPEGIAEIIGNLPWHIRHVDMDLYSDLDFERQKEPYLKALARIKPDLKAVPTKFKQLFPETAETPEALLTGARALLESYTMSTDPFIGRIKRLFSFHWGRHHLEPIADIIRRIDAPHDEAGKINTVQELMTALTMIPLENRKNGSLFRRIQYIETRIWAAEPAPVPAEEAYSSLPASSSSHEVILTSLGGTTSLPPGVLELQFSSSDDECAKKSIWDGVEDELISISGDLERLNAPVSNAAPRTAIEDDFYSRQTTAIPNSAPKNKSAQEKSNACSIL